MVSFPSFASFPCAPSYPSSLPSRGGATCQVVATQCSKTENDGQNVDKLLSCNFQFYWKIITADNGTRCKAGRPSPPNLGHGNGLPVPKGSYFVQRSVHVLAVRFQFSVIPHFLKLEYVSAFSSDDLWWRNAVWSWVPNPISTKISFSKLQFLIWILKFTIILSLENKKSEKKKLGTTYSDITPGNSAFSKPSFFLTLEFVIQPVGVGKGVVVAFW